MFEVIKLQTQHNRAIDVTPKIKEIIAGAGVTDGILTVSIPHTDAGLVIHSFWDPKGWDDSMEEIRRAFPSKVDYEQRTNNAHEAAAHSKAAFVGNVMSLIIKDGELLFGNSPGILFCEFNGPKNDREVHVNIM